MGSIIRGEMTMDIMNQFNQFRQNPMAFLMQKKINIPPEYSSDPRGAVQYLMNTGQMSQETFEQVRSRASQMGVKL